MRKQWNSRTIREEIERLDPNLKPGQDDYAAALYALSSAYLGSTKPTYAEELCKVRSGRFRGFAKLGKFLSPDEWSKPGGVVAFWLDVAMLQGLARKVEMDA